MDYEKGHASDEKAVHAPAASVGEQPGEWREQEDFMTRNGLNMKSFQRRPAAGPMVVLDKSMKTRHLNMIAIGGSIGAGFFVGSGSAFAKGGPGSVLIDFSLMGIMIFNVGKSRLCCLDHQHQT